MTCISGRRTDLNRDRPRPSQGGRYGAVVSDALGSAAGLSSGGGSVADRIRAAIVQGDFVPDQRLIEADLSERFSAGRAAIRAALVQLTGEGLVVRVQNRGARVRAVTVQEAVEITEVRMVLESLCASKAAERASATDVAALGAIRAQMLSAVDGNDVVAYSRANQALHRTVREISAQGTAAAVLERLRAQGVRHQFQLALRPGRPAVSLHEHLDIIDAICAGDGHAAADAMHRHLESVIRALREPTEGPISEASG